MTDDKKVLITISADSLSSQILFSFTAQTVGQESTTGSSVGKRIFQGAEWKSPGFIEGGSKVVYAQSPNAGTVMVIEEWGGD